MGLAATILGICGNLAALVLFLVPGKTFVTIVKKKSTLEFSGIPYVTTLMNNLLWILYGLPAVEGKVLVLTINGAGIVIQCAYILIFLIYASSQRERVKIFAIFVLDVVATAVLGFGIIMGINEKQTRVKILGILCVVLNVAMYYAPLSIMWLVIKTKSTKYMPFLLSLMVLINSLFWTIYGFLNFDIYIIIPNALGLAGGIVQLIIYACYHKPAALVEGEISSKESGGDNMEMGKLEQKQNSTRTTNV